MNTRTGKKKTPLIVWLVRIAMVLVGLWAVLVLLTYGLEWGRDAWNSFMAGWARHT